MLLGMPCAQRRDDGDGSGFGSGGAAGARRRHGRRSVGGATDCDPRAAAALVPALGFVGLTERWDESVLLFHAMLRLGPPRAVELLNTHPGGVRASASAAPSSGAAGDLERSPPPSSPRRAAAPPAVSRRTAVAAAGGDAAGGPGRRHPALHDAAPLGGFVDAADEMVYAAATRVFEARLAQHAGAIAALRANMTVEHAPAVAAAREPPTARNGGDDERDISATEEHLRAASPSLGTRRRRHALGDDETGEERHLECFCAKHGSS